MIKQIWLLIIIFDINCQADFSFYLNPTLQEFREKILTFQSESFVKLDKSFSEFYNYLESTLNETITTPFATLRETFSKSCSNFPMYSLEENAARRLINICDEVERLLKHTRPFVANVMSDYHNPDPETLSDPTPMEFVAEDYFLAMEKYLEHVIPIYNYNSNCTQPLLDEFYKLYSNPIEEMTKRSALLPRKYKSALRREFWLISKGIAVLTGVRRKLMDCSEEKVIDTFECIESFVDYNCKRRRTGCGPVYTSINIIKFHLPRIRDFYDSLFLSSIVSREGIKLADKKFSAWKEELNKCLDDEN